MSSPGPLSLSPSLPCEGDQLGLFIHLSCERLGPWTVLGTHSALPLPVHCHRALSPTLREALGPLLPLPQGHPETRVPGLTSIHLAHRATVRAQGMAGPHNTNIVWVRTRMGPGTQETLGDLWSPSLGSRPLALWQSSGGPVPTVMLE